MTYVITQPCCNDASCVAVCPVDCIHPTPAEAPFMRTEMLHIDPEACIDCGACVEVCPVLAIKPDYELEAEDEPYLELNADYFRVHPMDDAIPDFRSNPARGEDLSGLRVAIVGSGPSALYAAMGLVDLRGPRVRMYERLYTPYGLVRFGVAPDHQTTKAVTSQFASLERSAAFELTLGVEVGVHVSHEELMAHHHAVIYAVGASADRTLGIAGEDLPGSHAATEFVAWYNGHPEHTHRTFDLSGERAVIIGNGNVALDVARILLLDPAELTASDIAPHALEALRDSNIREVVVIGRRGIAQAGYTNPEMIALCGLPGVDVVIDGDEVKSDEVMQSILDDPDTESSVGFKVRFGQEVAGRASSGNPKRLVLRYLQSPTRINGADRVASIDIVRNRLEPDGHGSCTAVATADSETIDTSLVLRSVGYSGTAQPGLPFDADLGIVPNVDGRVVDPATGEVLPGVYVTGWIKRGPSGVIGTNKKCAEDTLGLLMQDHLAGGLGVVEGDAAELAALIAQRQPETLDFADWTRVDRAERDAGRALGRARVKFVDPQAMLDAARAESL
ncbi:FAD-dependent oxidoreductase [Tomitella biformata]|uniref:FAD-dependent oxidoreductase n=1 Tax=Tomitella biformata TaxID=630403 RepID=UPI0004673CC0|nr:FAD-dependent oxidoreductase [Tomitella biformata]